MPYQPLLMPWAPSLPHQRFVLRLSLTCSDHTARICIDGIARLHGKVQSKRLFCLFSPSAQNISNLSTMQTCLACEEVAESSPIENWSRNTDYIRKCKYWLHMQVQILITHANANTQQYFKERYLPAVWFSLMLNITDADASKPNSADADATKPNADAVIVMRPLWCGTLCP